jgi:hypothetical protein
VSRLLSGKSWTFKLKINIIRKPLTIKSNQWNHFAGQLQSREQCCGSVTIFFGSGSGSHFTPSFGSGSEKNSYGSGSGSY